MDFQRLTPEQQDKFKDVKFRKITDKNTNITWKPILVGDYIIGEYVKKEEDVGQNHSDIYKFKVDDFIIKVWSSKVITDKMEQISIGDTVKIVYMGTTTGRNNRKYKKYEVEVAE